MAHGRWKVVAGGARRLLRYLGATSKERARVIGELAARNAGMADILVDLEADYDLRKQLEIELLRQDAQF